MRASVLIGLLCLVVGCGSEPRSATGPRLYLAGDGQLWVVDAATGHVRHLVRAQLRPGGTTHRVLARGGRIVLGGEFGDSAFFLPSLRPDRVWVVDLSLRTGLVRSVREVTADGVTTVAAATPPGGERPLGAVADGLLIGEGDDLAVWDPVTGQVVRRLPVEPSGLGPSSAALVTSCADAGCASLRLTDARTGAARIVAAPPGLQFEAWNAAFSPSGDLLGVPVRGAAFGSRQLALVDVRGGRAAVVPGSVVAAGRTLVTWSEDGRYVFLAGDRALVAYRPGTPRAQPIDAAVGEFYDLAAI